ncbi:MAG: SAM-dependent methyltransferase [Nitrospirae bacterium]|nr:SAM-dependent methyltransferase [Nitrospirota bacterium]
MYTLEQIIIEKIKQEGPITFETFMDMALYCPELGYYSSGKRVIGRAGDFYTGPHLHPVFGAMLARQLMEMWDAMERPPVFHAVEMGAGTGYLCKDIFDYLRKPSDVPSVMKNKCDFLNALKYVIVEPYDHFERMQRETVGVYEKNIKWIRSLSPPPLTGGSKGEGESIAGCVFSNELPDAFPVHLVEMADELKEIHVDFNGIEFLEIRSTAPEELTNYLREFSISLQPGYGTEINTGIRSWLSEISAVLSRGFILTIDYGYSSEEYYSEERTRGTLLCYHKHQTNENPYENIGDQDITAHVNFSSLKKWGEAAGFRTIGYCPQGTFLIASGIDEGISELYPGEGEHTFEMAKIKGLIFPQGMGETHKVMVQYKGEDTPKLRGFTLRNQTGHL